MADRVRDEAAKSAGDAAKSAGDGVNESTARGIRTGTRTGSGSGSAADAGGGLLRRVRPVVGSWDAALVVALILVVAVVVLVRLATGTAPGGRGVDLSVFTPAPGTDGSALFLGIVFGFLSFAGFEAAATLGEETRDPRRTIPRPRSTTSNTTFQRWRRCWRPAARA